MNDTIFFPILMLGWASSDFMGKDRLMRVLV